LVPTEIAPLFTPEYVYFNAQAFGVSAAKLFFRRLSVSAAYTQVRSSSDRLGISNYNSGNRFGITATYHIRKLSFQGGFSQVNQQFVVVPALAAPSPARAIDSYFVSVSRWFNFF